MTSEYRPCINLTRLQIDITSTLEVSIYSTKRASGSKYLLSPGACPVELPSKLVDGLDKIGTEDGTNRTDDCLVGLSGVYSLPCGEVIRLVAACLGLQSLKPAH